MLLKWLLPSPQTNDAHLQRPDATDPHLQLALNALNILELDALPPASPGRLTPEQKQLLGHTHRISTHVVTPDVAA